MVKKHFKELVLILGLVVALLIGNYLCLAPVHTVNKSPSKPVSLTNEGYIAPFTEFVILSTKIILKPLDR